MITVILGPSCSGKTTLAKRLHEERPLSSLYFTDDYIGYEFAEAVDILIADISRDPNPDKIIEGVQAARMLRKGHRENSFRAGEIIVCSADESVRDQRYKARNDGKDIEKRKTFDKVIQDILNEYLSEDKNAPTIKFYHT